MTKGQVGCLPCGLATKSCYSKILKNLVYYGNHMYLPKTHPYRRAQTTFNGKIENNVKLSTKKYTIEWVMECESR